MSEESKLEAAFCRYSDPAAPRWGGAVLTPDEALMRKEDGEADDEAPRWGWLLEEVLVFLFADNEPMQRMFVSRRAWALIRAFAPSLLVGRSLDEAPAMESTGPVRGSFPMREFHELCQEPQWGDAMYEMLLFLFPHKSSRWIEEGTRRCYLAARAYQPDLVKTYVKRGKREVLKEMSFDDFAIAFGESEESVTGARARWSWRADQTLSKPIERNGGVAHAQFQKSATASANYAQAAMGNRNRKKSWVKGHESLVEDIS